MLNKTKRLFTSLLPVDSARTGACNRCGACCKLSYPCPFLRFDDQGLSRCAVYAMRPPSCRKYPRVAAEQMTPQECGYSFATADARVPDAIGRDPVTDPL